MSGAPTFSGKEATEFLWMLHSLFHNHQVTKPEDKLQALSDYVSIEVGQWLESLPEFQEQDYQAVEELLLEEYREQDSTQVKMNIRWLLAYVHQNQTLDDDLVKYVWNFMNVSNELMKCGQLVEYLRT